LIDDNVTNADAYCQRARLYAKLEEYPLAIEDYISGVCFFNSAIKLDSTLTKSHLHLGILYIRQTKEPEKAIVCVNNAIFHGNQIFTLDPTSLRGYLCRGEYFENLIAG
jgi:tetratricopeptide (TPR) repeat protein